jgi:hypothetical protein
MENPPGASFPVDEMFMNNVQNGAQEKLNLIFN